MKNKETPPDAAEERNARLCFLENLERIDQAIRQETDVEQMLWKAINEMLAIFNCDRVWLLYPCDPDAPSWRIPVEITRPEYPGAHALNAEIPMSDDAAEAMRQVLATNEPMSGVLAPNEPQWDEEDKYGVRSFMLTAVHPKVGKPWELGLHQCSYPRVWTREEQKLFKEIGLRIGDALSNILILRNLRESESLLKETQALTKVGGWIFDVESGMGVWTDEVYRIHGLPVDPTINHFEKGLEYYHPDDRPIIEKALRQIVEEGRPFNLESRFTTAKGDSRWVQTMANPIKKGDRVVKVAGNIMDITERKQAEETHRAHLHFLESLELVDRAIRQETDVEKLLWHVMETVFQIFKCDRAWLMDPCDPEAPFFRVPVEVCRPEYPGAEKLNIEVPMKPGADKVCAAALAARGPVIYGPQAERQVYKELTAQFGVLSQITLAIYPKVGKPWLFGMHQCSHPRIWTPEEQRLFHEIGRRIADGLSSVLFLRELQQNEERFRATFEQAAVGVAHVAPDGQWLRVNRKLCDIVGYSREELLGMTCLDISHPDDLDDVRRMLNKEISTKSVEKRYLRKDDAVVWINLTVSAVRSTSGFPIYFIYVIEDISERKRAEEEQGRLQRQLVQAQKMESVGRLAGGVAHDYNNMLSVIIGYAELALKKVAPSQPLHADIEHILSAAKRSADITRQLLAFARKQTIAPKVLDLNEAVEGMLKMIRRFIGEDIDLAWLPKAGAGEVKMDPAQIDQILANLCVNARDAIAGVGKITIETDGVVFDEVYCALQPVFVPGEYVVLSVADNGCGMEKDKLDQIFEPFFTTKEGGKGTGLGLATVYGIVKQNNGFINVYSEPQKGTTFRIYLPSFKDKLKKISNKIPVQDMQGGSESILLVEDEPVLLELSKEMLETLGYRVLAAGTPGEAVRLAGEHGGRIDLLLTDVVMPEMNGRELGNQLLSLYPNLKQLYMSGHTANVISHHGVLEEGMCFLQKPFAMKELSAKVREALQKK